MKEAYVSFEIAKLLKEKGFSTANCQNSPHFAYNRDGQFSGPSWDTEYHAPTIQMAMKWLREKHNIHIGINPISGKGYNATIYDVADFDDCGIISDTEFFFHVEEAVEAALKYTLENLI